MTSRIFISLSDRRPVTVTDRDWPVIAATHRHNYGRVECQANTEWNIRVREHADGRRIIYGSKRAGGGGQSADLRPIFGGFLVDAADVLVADTPLTIRAIRRMGDLLDDPHLAAECISELPAEDL